MGRVTPRTLAQARVRRKPKNAPRLFVQEGAVLRHNI